MTPSERSRICTKTRRGGLTKTVNVFRCIGCSEVYDREPINWKDGGYVYCPKCGGENFKETRVKA